MDETATPTATATEAVHLALPLAWAGYLLYGNTDSLRLDESAELAMVDMIETWMASRGLDSCLRIAGKPYFAWANDGPMRMPAKCVMYAFSPVRH